MIKRVRVNGKYVYRVVSEHTNRNLGTYATMAEAKQRLREVEYFKLGIKGQSGTR